jgi:adenine-specific DNA-methyltransferase
MDSFQTDRDRLDFLLEAEAEFHSGFFGLSATGEVIERFPLAIGRLTPTIEPSSTVAKTEERPKYITNYIGSKQKLIDWIWKHTPEDVESVFDAFSGSAVVAYMYKSKGLQVYANDRLRYCFHTARAIVENSSTQLSDEEIEKLVSKNSGAGSFVRDNFKGIFFAEGVHAVIDQIRANCDDLAGYKKDIALFCLGKTCLGGKGGFGHFSASTVSSGHQDNPDEFRERFRKNAKRINGLIFDNGEENKAYRDDINQILPKVKADLAYFDPPYATEYSTTNYEKFYHFIEGLMTYWEGLKIKSDTKVKAYETDHVTVTKANATEFFKGFLGNATHIDHWLISYRDHAYPNEDDMKQIIGDLGRDSQMKTKDHQYSITSQHGEASQAKERLFICRKAAASKSKAEVPAKPKPLVAQANFHTILPVEIQLSEPSPMNAEGMDVSVSGDPQFSFILCRVGTNKNGDHFTAEELSARHMTAVNKKIDLQHSQDVSDIVGGIIAADYLEDTTGGRVECVGELYTRDSQYSQLAYKLMKRGIVSQVSMECDYEEGECSVCGKRFKSKADYCQHLRKFKGQIYNGETVFEILHNVTFTGLGLLDRKGADENARIIQVASTQEPINNQSLQGEKPMEEQTKKEEPSSEAAKKPADNGGGGGSPDTAKVTQLENENKQLRSQVTELQKRIQELEATQKAAASQARAGKLLERLIKQGLEFGDEEAREKELKRLAGLSDEAFAATEAAFELAAKKKTIPPEDEEEEDEDDEEDADADSGKKKKSVPDSKKAKASTKASREGGMRGNASVRPRDVDDRKVSLEDRLRSGFMAAYQERIGQEVEDQENINA